MKAKFNYPFKKGGVLSADDMNVIGDMMKGMGYIDAEGNVIGDINANGGTSSAIEYANIEKNIYVDFDLGKLNALFGDEVLPKDTIVRVPFNYCDIEPNKYYVANGRMTAQETDDTSDKTIVTLPVPVSTILNCTPQNIVNRSSKLYSTTIKILNQQLSLPFLYSDKDTTISGYPYRMDFDASMIAAGFLTGISVPARISLLFNVDPIAPENKGVALKSKIVVSIMGFDMVLEDIPTTSIIKVVRNLLTIEDVLDFIDYEKGLSYCPKYVYGPDHPELKGQTKYGVYSYEKNQDPLSRKYPLSSYRMENGKLIYDVNGDYYISGCYSATSSELSADNYYYRVTVNDEDVKIAREKFQDDLQVVEDTIRGYFDALNIDRDGFDVTILDTYTADKMHSFMVSVLGLNELDPSEELGGLQILPGTNVAPELLCPFGPMLWFPGEIVENTTGEYTDYPYMFNQPINLKYKLSDLAYIIDPSATEDNIDVDVTLNLYLKSPDKFAQGMAECSWSFDSKSDESSTPKSGTLYLHTFLLNTTDSYQEVNEKILKRFLLRFLSLASIFSFTTNIPFVWDNNPPSLALGCMNEITITNGIGTCIETPITNVLNIDSLIEQLNRYLEPFTND